MSRADRFTESSLKEQVYSDFLTNLNRHPVSGDVVRFVNENAVIRSIKNLLMTNRGERLYQPSLGSNIRAMLFENMSDASADEIASLARETIEQHEPRVQILSIKALPDEKNNRYVLALTIMVINKQTPVSFNINLTRVR